MYQQFADDENEIEIKQSKYYRVCYTEIGNSVMNGN